MALVVTLLLVGVAPSVCDWRRISAYAALPRLEVVAERNVTLASQGIPGEASGQGIAVDAHGAVFVADLEGGRLLGYRDGTEASGTVLAGPPRDPLLRAFALALTPEGNLALLEEQTGVVHVFSPSGRLLQALPLATRGARAIAIDDDGAFYVAGGGVLRKYRSDGRPDLGWGETAASGKVSFPEVTGLAIANGLLYAVLPVSREIALLDSQGHVVERQPLLGLAGMLCAGPHGTLYMSEQRAARIWILDRSGKTVGRILGPRGDEDMFKQPRGLAALADGRLWVVNDDFLTLYRPLGRKEKG
jgi:sugar lactone lactonase YvrE